ncbi:transmembrane 9 superfamily member 11-like [Phragmites australis]|uniref:transmembrane 9 superfamily member 11-like n=1 Tax=Phragmites australis TaxID=29695 RepID=UPI002D76EC97|nr:transmembrane 9 superfamily member 11-like [Phragmites australis]
MAMACLCTSATLSILLFILLIHSGHSPAAAFYFPGSYPHRYRPGDALAAKVNSLTSPSSKLPYPYYSLPFCSPQDGIRRAAESLGELLLGDRIETSPYRFSMLNNTTALFLCRTDPVAPATAELVKSRIDDAYQVNLLLDTLPVMRNVKNQIAPDVLLRFTGFPVGVRADDGEYYVYNHLKLTVLVNKQNAITRVETLMATADAAELISFSGGKEGGGYTVVGFEVVPCSVEHDAAAVKEKNMYDEIASKAATGCDPSVVGMRVQENRSLVFSYEVSFLESSIEWPSRWDAYLEMGGAKVHWFSILNSIVVVAFLAAIVLVILLRTVRRDLAHYEELGSESGAHVDDLAGWKIVAGDVFREPSHPVLLCVLVGDGVRILGMGVVTILFAALGFMSPASRGALITGMLCFYLVLGLVAGYTSVSLWKTVRQGDSAGWKSVAWSSSCAVFPGVGFAVFTVLNCVLWYNGSTGAVPFLLFVVILLLWFFVSVPLNLIGGLIASRVRHVEYPVKTNKIARQVPSSQCSPWVFVAMAGTLPFGTLFIELFFIMSSLWLGRVYYVFGFLLVVLALLVTVCAEVSVVLTYMGLSVEDWRWWWRAFFASGSVAFYTLGYAVYYLVFDLHSLAGPVSAVLYVGYSLLMALAVMLATGAVGLGASFCFVYHLFSTVKLD